MAPHEGVVGPAVEPEEEAEITNGAETKRCRRGDW